MDSALTTHPNPVVMAQQIQALIANVQELIKQNEELKRKAHPRTPTMSQSRRNRNDNNDGAHNP